MKNKNINDIKRYFFKVFMKTGSINAYLAYKKLEKEDNDWKIKG